MRGGIAIATWAWIASAACLPACASVIGLDELHRGGAGASDAGGPAANGGPGEPAGSSSGGGSSASSTSTQASGGDCGDHPGSPMVRVTANGDSFCVDANEATNADYQAFLASHPSSSLLPDSCNGRDFHPNQWGNGDGSKPVTGIDWCDASAFCAWAGKSLCGKTSGGALDATDDATKGEWYAACAAGALGSITVAEWENSCTGDNTDDLCAARGIACDARQLSPRSAPMPSVGVRCCTP